MSIEKINLRKLLQLFFADDRLRRSLLLTDIRNDRTKEAGGRDSGGDFYGPFWSDAKNHAAGLSSLAEQTKIRIAANKTRARLYPILRDCFLSMWSEKMRWRNEPFEVAPETVKAQLPIKELGTTVKIENTAAIRTWNGSYRVIYPYFSEAPILPEEGARLGFWALNQALPDYQAEDLRIIDMQRRSYFRPRDVGMKGNEGNQFLKRYEFSLARMAPTSRRKQVTRIERQCSNSTSVFGTERKWAGRQSQLPRSKMTHLRHCAMCCRP